MADEKSGADRAIEAPLQGTHIQIIACAGSGKTETMALRVARLLSEEVDPESVVAFTFTEKAADELKQRILRKAQSRCSETVLGRIGRMYVGTIHAYALNLLQTYARRYAGYDLIQEDALYAWVARHAKAILGSAKWSGMWERIGEFLSDADMVENEGLNVKGRDDFSERYRSFVATLDSHRLLTFGRSIVAAVEELEKESVRNRVHESVHFVFVDEYQDINPAQERLIRGLVGPQTQLCVVGDDDQSIYQWRGSDVGVMQGFAQRYRPVLRAELSINKRSLPSIVTFAADFAKTIKPRLRKVIEYDRKQGADSHPLRILRPETRESEAEMIAAAVGDLTNAGWHCGEIAVLIRWWRQAPPILKAFEGREIAYDCGGGSALFATELGYLLAAGFLLATGSYIPYGWKQSHLPQPPATTSAWFRQISAFLNLTADQRAGAKRWIEHLSREARDQSGTRPASPVGDLYDLADAIGVRSWDLANKQQHLWFGTFARFSQVLEGFETARLSGRWKGDGEERKFTGAHDRGNWFYSSLGYYLAHMQKNAGGFVAPPDPTAPAVRITTIHSSKGLQWPVVFIPGLEQDRFPSKYVGQRRETKVPKRLVSAEVLSRYAGTDSDERRLFYVAATRARDLLVLSSPQKVAKNSVLPSPYYQYAVKYSEAWAPPKGAGPAPRPVEVSTYHAPVPALSFSEMALYGSCPFAYRLAAEFDIATPLSRDLGYGKSVHHILRCVAEDVKRTGKVPGSDELDNLFDSEFHVPFATTTGHERMRESARKLVDRYIKDWNDDLHRIWEVERPFELHLDSVIITGRADVILDRNGGTSPELTIVDYKTYDAKETDRETADQLRTYTAAARAEGYDVGGAILHNLKNATRHDVSVDEGPVSETLDRARSWADGIVRGDFAPAPDRKKCGGCDYRRVCHHRA